MALKKQTKVKGFDAEYWRISRIENNFNAAVSIVNIALYKDEAARRETPTNFILEKSLIFKEEMTRGTVYNSIKELNFDSNFNVTPIEKTVGENDEIITNENLFFANAESC